MPGCVKQIEKSAYKRILIDLKQRPQNVKLISRRFYCVCVCLCVFLSFFSVSFISVSKYKKYIFKNACDNAWDDTERHFYSLSVLVSWIIAFTYVAVWIGKTTTTNSVLCGKAIWLFNHLLVVVVFFGSYKLLLESILSKVIWNVFIYFKRYSLFFRLLLTPNQI